MQAPPRIRPPVRPVTPATPATPVDAARQDRFLRQLVPSLWDELADAEAAELLAFDSPVDAIDEGSADGSPSQGDEGRRDGGDETPEPPPPAPPDVADAAPSFPHWSWMHAAGAAPERGHSDTPQGEAVAPATGASCAGDAPWLGDIVQQVTQLTAGSDARFQHWSITVPLDPEALPDCELRLSLSPGSMALRFRTGSATSAALVSRHRDALRARLEALPSSPSAIDIDLE
ncbi:type III secretion HpaP family protein [Ideonella sp. YS5]|uniref:type III secretion HpaP family protein n=1 Tax=Ideonella sp. YS5 TaxID=3453714 RepID=UPI003EED0F05